MPQPSTNQRFNVRRKSPVTILENSTETERRDQVQIALAATAFQVCSNGMSVRGV